MIKGPILPFIEAHVGRFLFLLISLLLYFALRPFLEGFVGVNIMMDIFLTIILLSGIYAVSQKRNILIFALIFAIPLLFVQWANYVVDIPSFILAGKIFGILFFGYTTIIILSYLLREKKITGDVIIGAICAYFMLGFMWALVFNLLELIEPGSFQTPDISGAELSFFSYYSFVTLTTLGYGDITPLTAPARSLSLLEAIIGQLYVAVLIGRLVGIHISQSGKN